MPPYRGKHRSDDDPVSRYDTPQPSDDSELRAMPALDLDPTRHLPRLGLTWNTGVVTHSNGSTTSAR